MVRLGPDKVAVPTHTYKVVLCVHPSGDKEIWRQKVFWDGSVKNEIGKSLQGTHVMLDS
jgi:DNA/RNA endonuclease G (NUC1)